MTAGADVVVRPGRVDDLPALTQIYNHYVVHSHATFDLEPFTVDERREWFGHYAASGPHRLLVADVVGVVRGYATSSTFRVKPAYATSVETTVYCSPSVAGRGIGTALYDELLGVLAGEDLHRAYAGVALPNEASEALHRRFGFREVGTYHEVGRKHGRWWDVRWYERPMP